MQDRWGDHLAVACREAGLDTAAAVARAEHCRREVLGMGLDLCAGRLEPGS